MIASTVSLHTANLRPSVFSMILLLKPRVELREVRVTTTPGNRFLLVKGPPEFSAFALRLSALMDIFRPIMRLVPPFYLYHIMCQMLTPVSVAVHASFRRMTSWPMLRLT